MKKLNHTPGPWVADNDGFIVSPEYSICQFFSKDEMYFNNWEANAKLIAQAPNLLFALQTILAFSQGTFSTHIHTIAKDAVDAVIGNKK